MPDIPKRREDLRRALLLAAVAAGLVAMVLLLFVRAMAGELNHDEHQFVAPSVLLLRSGLLPYRDYPFFHMPNLVFALAAIFPITSHLLLAARCFNTLCAAILLLLIFSVAARRFNWLQEKRWVVALMMVLLLSLNPFFRFTAGRAWNHDLAVLAAVAAFAVWVRAGTSQRALLWIALCGGLMGLAVGTRLSMAPLVAPFALAILLFPTPGSSRLIHLAIYSLSLGLALLPAALLFVAAPGQFVFDNFTYNSAVNYLYRESTIPGQLSFLNKLSFPLRQTAKSPCDLALGAGFVFFALRPMWRGGWRNVAAHREAAVLLLILPFLFMGAWAPTPSYRQYYYPFIPFLLLGNIYGIARERPFRARTGWLIALTLFVSLLEAIPNLPYTPVILQPRSWPVFTVHEKAEAMAALLPRGRVLTLAPIFPLEAKLDIYEQFAVGPFAWRTAALIDKERQATCKFVAPNDLDRFLAARPPSAILTGFEHSELEAPLLAYVKEHRYLFRRLPERGAFWLRRKPLPPSAAYD